MKHIFNINFFKHNFSLILSLFLILICAGSYLFILEDTFSFSKLKRSEEGVATSNKITTTDSKLVLDLDTLNSDVLELVDTTKIDSDDFVIEASYRISNLDYFYDSFKVPYINIDSNDARLVNEEIKNNYKTWAKDSAKYKEAFSNSSLDASLLVRTDYNVYTYENVLSILITFITREDSIESRKYYTYSFNTSNESLLISDMEQILSIINPEVVSSDNSSDEILESDTTSTKSKFYGKLLTFNELLTKLNLSFEEVDMKYKEILRTYSGEYGDLNNINDTLNLYNEEIKSNTLKAFIDSDGSLNLVSKVFTPLYSNGTYRIFKYNGLDFVSSSYIENEI